MDDNENDNSCSICLLNLDNNIGILNCGHSFHLKCIEDWREKNDSCPICRNQIIYANYDHNNNNFNRHIIPKKKNINKFIYLSLLLLLVSSNILLIRHYYHNKPVKESTKFD
jgi:hypothetical protein